MPRRRTLRLLAGAATIAMAEPSFSAAAPGAMLRRPIHRSGELLPVIGLGTYRTFDVGPRDPQLKELAEVLRLFTGAGGSAIDSSPMYGEAERTVGDLAADAGLHDRLFLATKVWTSGREAGVRQMRESMRLMRAKRIDLMQVHNLLDVDTHLKTLREWQAAGTIRYLGITHYHSGAYRELERLIATRAWDFVQFNYSMDEREAEARLLPLCADTGTAVIVNRPFAHAGLFQKVRGRPLPAWAVEFDCTSWAQFFLKYVLAHPAVICVIPGTGRVGHLRDNVQAGYGRLPDQAMRRRMLDHLRAL
ncbi:MAG: aldo/keto reductase [Burkholderiales bacterium]|nr:aldo/keto reductase [Burkholderiales bacterium]